MGNCSVCKSSTKSERGEMFADDKKIILGYWNIRGRG